MIDVRFPLAFAVGIASCNVASAAGAGPCILPVTGEEPLSEVEAEQPTRLAWNPLVLPGYEGLLPRPMNRPSEGHFYQIIGTAYQKMAVPAAGSSILDAEVRITRGGDLFLHDALGARLWRLPRDRTNGRSRTRDTSPVRPSIGTGRDRTAGPDRILPFVFRTGGRAETARPADAGARNTETETGAKRCPQGKVLGDGIYLSRIIQVSGVDPLLLETETGCVAFDGGTFRNLPELSAALVGNSAKVFRAGPLVLVQSAKGVFRLTEGLGAQRIETFPLDKAGRFVVVGTADRTVFTSTDFATFASIPSPPPITHSVAALPDRPWMLLVGQDGLYTLEADCPNGE